MITLPINRVPNSVGTPSPTYDSPPSLPAATPSQNTRGGRVKLLAIGEGEAEFDHPEKGDALYAMELALSLEKLNFDKLMALWNVSEEWGVRGVHEPAMAAAAALGRTAEKLSAGDGWLQCTGSSPQRTERVPPPLSSSLLLAAGGRPEG